MIDIEKLTKALAARDKFLNENPEAREYQREIDAELDKAGESMHNRLAIMENLIVEKRLELVRVLKELSFSVEAMGLAAKAYYEEKEE